jgi:hypothetical protein
MVRDWATKKPNALGFLRAYPDCDWAIVPRSGVVVLDLEMKNGLDGLADLMTLGPVPDCPTTFTKSGGRHLWFRCEEPLTGGHHLLPGLEAKAENGSVHIPPSVGYTWQTQLVAPHDLPLLPQRILDKWKQTATLRACRDGSTYRTETYPLGERRARLCSMAGRLRNEGLTEPELLAALLAIRDARCEDPSSFTDHEIKGIAKDYAKRPERTEPDCSWFPKAT